MAQFEERDFAESDPRQYSASSESKNFAKGTGCLAVIGLATLLGWSGWGYFKRIGWIPQSRVFDVYMRGDWLTGEFRACQTDGLVDVLFCPNSDESKTALTASGP